MSDPDFVKLAAGITVLSDPTTAWGLSQNSVAAFPSGVGGGGGAGKGASGGSGGNGADGLVVVVGHTLAAPAGFEGIYMQATQPSNPSNGDVWIDTNGGERAIWTYDGSWAQWGEVDPP